MGGLLTTCSKRYGHDDGLEIVELSSEKTAAKGVGKKEKTGHIAD
jgi:hypothetical protein